MKLSAEAKVVLLKPRLENEGEANHRKGRHWKNVALFVFF